MSLYPTPLRTTITTLHVCRKIADDLVHVQTRENAIVNRLNKTKIEKEVDHESERQERLRIEGRKKKAEAVERVC